MYTQYTAERRKEEGAKREPYHLIKMRRKMSAWEPYLYQKLIQEHIEGIMTGIEKMEQELNKITAKGNFIILTEPSYDVRGFLYRYLPTPLDAILEVLEDEHISLWVLNYGFLFPFYSKNLRVINISLEQYEQETHNVQIIFETSTAPSLIDMEECKR